MAQGTAKENIIGHRSRLPLHCIRLNTSTISLIFKIDLGAPHIVCGIGIQGTGQDFRIDEKTRDYYIEFSLDGVDWHIVLPSGEGVVSFEGNLKREQDYPGDVYIKKNIFTDKNLLVARFYRIYPLNFDGHKCVRTELYGLRQEWRGSLGLETIAGKSNVFDQQITASSFLDKHTTPPKARLYSPSSWCAKTKGSYLQIDMKKVQEFRGLAFHADARDNNKRVLEFELQYGYDHSKLTRTKIKTELTAKKEIKSYWLPRPANARYVRIQPTKWHNKPCIRTELYVNNVRGNI
ncbi:Neuropilin-1 [Exaiptasia diaphana]|nr:Neuropilin-1 [Exaiptasia diaphana]